MLHQQLSLSQIPYRYFLVYDIHRRSSLDPTLRDALLASALYRETQLYPGDRPAQLMAYRIKNCVLVAQHLSADYSVQNEQLLYKKLCTVVSSSRCCWNYIFTLRYSNGDAFVHCVDHSGAFPREQDILLEVSLLLVIGYQLADVRRWMLRLGRLGMLVGYREHAVYSKRPGRVLVGRSDLWPLSAQVQLHMQYDSASWAEEAFEESVRASEEALDQEIDDEFRDLERRFNV